MRDHRIKNIVDAYCKNHRIDFDPYAVKLHKFSYGPYAERLAHHYISGPAMAKPLETVAYQVFIRELESMYRHLLTPFNIVPELCDDDPFNSYAELKAGFNGNVLPIRATKTDTRCDILEHMPLYQDSGYFDIHGRELKWNDVFRFVHDVFSHLAFDLEFGYEDEIQASLIHADMFSSESLPALWNEVIFQQSAFVLSGCFDAEQRTVTIPDWFSIEQLYEDRKIKTCMG